MAINPNTNFTAGQVLTADQQNRFPRGVMGISTRTTNKTFTALEDSGLTVTWTAESTRLYKISFAAGITSSGIGLVFSFITNSANVSIKEALTTIPSAGYVAHLSPFVTVTGLSGSVTYKVRVQNQTGTGTLNASATDIATMLVEDIGPA